MNKIFLKIIIQIKSTLHSNLITITFFIFKLKNINFKYQT